jgi:hypothetical protein
MTNWPTTLEMAEIRLLDPNHCSTNQLAAQVQNIVLMGRHLHSILRHLLPPLRHFLCSPLC